MRIFKRALRVLLCATLICSLGISATACDVDEGENPGPGDQIENPGDETGTPSGPVFTPPDDGSEGIDWTKYWDGVSNTSSSADNFKFTGSKDIGSVSGEFLPDIGSTNTSESVTVKFSDGVPAQIVENGALAVKPITPEKDGSMFVDWYTDSSYATKYDFNSPVTTALNLVAKWATLDSRIQSVNGYSESLAVTWTDSNPEGASVEYKSASSSTWQTVDAPLIRKVDGNARVDIVGLTAGEYNVKITPSSGSAYTLPEPITVNAYDRSGYGHFNYTDGIGAYNDDGTLKDGALVIYLTESNKNNVKEYVYKNTSNGLVKEDITSYIKPGRPTANGKDLGGDSYWSIGYILNNRGYENNTERESYGIQKLCSVYGAVAVRILGQVSSELNSDKCSPTLTGLTYYSKAGNVNPITGETYKKGVSVPNGGTVNDNGQLARITNAHNLTIEGIGEDAKMFGWGVHFVSNDNLQKLKKNNYYGGAAAGTSFEVRNVTFESYPEDAIGMEGTQGKKVDQTTGSITSGDADADADLISPVERCWIHNNVFLPGYCAAPAESDKSEGDGSCDFKRGQYYTLSYNYFEDCHKTNLIGSSDNTVTFNVSIHHNWYKHVESRQPLARRANIHYYNNYISDASDYVTSFRGNCLVFSEANYYDGCKNVTQKKDGEGVAWNNIYNSCYDENNYTELTSRTQTVSNNCKFIYRNIDYSKFYIESDKFYYDSVNKVSKCLLDTATGARERVIQYAGVNNFGLNKTAMNQYTPTETATTGKVTLPSTKPSAKANGVLFNGLTGTSSGTIKGKGQIITFSLSAPSELQVTTTTTGDFAPELFSSNGKLYAGKFTGTLTIVLPAGTYVIASGQKDKEATITSLEFADTAASSEARINSAKTALAAIPSTITMSSENAITEAGKAYSALLANEKSEIPTELYQQYAKAVAAYNELQVDYVIARINHIGTVDTTSYNKINAAQTAYSKLPADKQSQVTNLSTLTAAQETFKGFAAQNVINRLSDLPDLSQATIKSRETIEKLNDWFDAVSGAYEKLEDDQQATVKEDASGATYKKLTDGRAELVQVEKFFDFKDALADATVANAATDGAKLKTLYEGLTTAQQQTISAEDKAKYDEIIAAYTDFASKAVTCTFLGATPSNNTNFKVNSGGAKNSPYTINAYGGALATGLKMESATQVVVTVATKMQLKLYFDASGDVRIGTNNVTNKTGNKNEPNYSTASENGDNVVTVTLEAGTYYVTKNSSFNLYYATLTPAA